jgi:pterin-4a-carbinolamine dehydratase
MSYKPKLDEFTLELIGSADTGIEKAIVEYEVPFANGGILDDMGVKARRFQIKTIWRKDNYEQHQKFLDHVTLEQTNTLIHPEFGIIRGRVKSANVTHDSRRLCAEISIEFAEDKNPDAVPTYNLSLEANLEDGFNKSMASLIDSIAAELAEEGLDPSVEVDPNKSLGGQVPARKVSARALLAKMDQSVSALNKASNAVLNPVESAIGMFNYGASLPGAIIGAVARAVERTAMIANSAGNAPNIFVASMRSSVSRLVAAVPALGRQIMVAAANIAALFTGKMFNEDESKKTALRRIEDTPERRYDRTAPKVSPPPKVLTASELDESMARVREMVLDGITAARAIGCTPAVSVLASQADELTRYINVVKLERDRIIVVEAENPTPLHLICLRHGLPYTYADRICTINSFWNPTFCLGEVKLYGRRS